MMDLFSLAAANARTEFARTLPAQPSESIEPRTHYAIRRKADGWWWLFEDRFVASATMARRFAFHTTAYLTCANECPADHATWTVEPVIGA